jgi:hypothetical protein
MTTRRAKPQDTLNPHIQCQTYGWLGTFNAKLRSDPPGNIPRGGQAHKVLNVSGQPTHVGVDRHPSVPSQVSFTIQELINHISM